MEMEIRPARAEDLSRINEIYNSYIVGKHTSFDTEPWTEADRAAWFDKYRSDDGRHVALVACRSQLVVGFASSSPFRSKRAYDTSVETTVVLEEHATGHGIGTALLGHLVDVLTDRDVHRAYALIALPNDPSIKSHERVGYRTVGVMDEVGHKLDRYHSVLIMEYRFA
jgi:phosphinothricin acetyltransferase